MTFPIRPSAWRSRQTFWIHEPGTTRNLLRRLHENNEMDRSQEWLRLQLDDAWLQNARLQVSGAYGYPAQKTLP